jgi:hypothetical protein
MASNSLPLLVLLLGELPTCRGRGEGRRMSDRFSIATCKGLGPASRTSFDIVAHGRMRLPFPANHRQQQEST